MGGEGGLEIRAEHVVCTFNSFNLGQCPLMTASLHICAGYFELHDGENHPSNQSFRLNCRTFHVSLYFLAKLPR